ncbi:hypothetical protein LCGC14_3051720, partial [marine sediment metagenome]
MILKVYHNDYRPKNAHEKAGELLEEILV